MYFLVAKHTLFRYRYKTKPLSVKLHTQGSDLLKLLYPTAFPTSPRTQRASYDHTALYNNWNSFNNLLIYISIRSKYWSPSLQKPLTLAKIPSYFFSAISIYFKTCYISFYQASRNHCSGLVSKTIVVVSRNLA